ncbi:MAG: UvrB/UvrC motif-containing protein [Spirochaetes bacterium]|nr:UvrB/UvrC motif-containing protein [Spirochaetota bacterium]
MICERCKKNEASIHLSEVIKDMRSEIHLCENCANEVGLNAKISDFSISIPEMLTFMNIDEITDYKDGKFCTACGSSFIDYKRDKKLGCPECYSNMSEFITPVLTGYHGETRHIGKSPLYNEKVYYVNDEQRNYSVNTKNAGDLQAQLDSAVNDERYEEAAILRDKIREIKLTLKQN